MRNLKVLGSSILFVFIIAGFISIKAQEPSPAPEQQQSVTQTPAPAQPSAPVPAPVATQIPAAAPVTVAPPMTTATPAPVQAAPVAPEKFVLAEGTDVPLTFDQDLSSKTAAEGDPVTLLLADDLMVGNVTVAKAGARAIGEVTNAKKSGMMGKAGELNIRVDYLRVGEAKIKLRGSKGKEGQSGVTSTVVLTVLFGPIGLIKHGSNIEIKKGSAIKVYVADDIALKPIQ